MNQTPRPPLVSVVMPAFNAARTLAEAMRSVLNQTIVDVELIVVDDASLDDTRIVANALAKIDSRVRVLCTPVNSGAAVARNLGMSKARGEFIAFLDSDDRWLERKLELQLPLFEDPATVLVGSWYQTVDTTWRIIGQAKIPVRVGYQELVGGTVVGCLTSVFRASALGNSVQFRLPAKRSRGAVAAFFGWRPIQEDFLFWVELFRANPGAIARNVQQPLAQYMLRGGSASAGKHRAAYFHWHILRHDLALGWLEASRYFLRYVLLALAKQVRYRSVAQKGQEVRQL